MHRSWRSSSRCALVVEMYVLKQISAQDWNLLACDWLETGFYDLR